MGYASHSQRDDRQQLVLAIVAFAIVIAVVVLVGVLNLIWWRECVDAGGVYVNGKGVLPSCLRSGVIG